MSEKHEDHEERKTKDKDEGPKGEKGDARRDEHNHSTGKTRNSPGARNRGDDKEE